MNIQQKEYSPPKVLHNFIILVQGTWSVTWQKSNLEAMVTLQESNGVLQGQGVQTTGERFTVRVTVSGNTAQFQINVFHPNVSQNSYDGIISADRRTIDTPWGSYQHLLGSQSVSGILVFPHQYLPFVSSRIPVSEHP